MPRGQFDAERFYAALDGQREAKGLNRKQEAQQAGVSASTLTRMAQGKLPDVQGLSALLSWSGLSMEDFIDRGETKPTKPEPLAMISTYLRADKNLAPASAKALDEVLKAAYGRLRKQR